jgi:limonene-1,2-epoxide hydrolase
MEQPTDPTAVVQAFLTAFEAMDFDTALEYLAADVEYTNIPIGTLRGHDGVRQALGPFFAPIHENDFVVKHIAADGPVVFIERLDRHRLDHGWRELPVVGVFEIEDGLIARWREYFDMATATKIHGGGEE